jgi:putative endonuclease
MDNNYYMYIALCNDKSLYTGMTTNLKSRERKHNDGSGSSYTKNKRPIQIIYFESFKSKQEAAKRERQIKGWSKIKKERLTKGKHPNKSKLL